MEVTPSFLVFSFLFLLLLVNNSICQSHSMTKWIEVQKFKVNVTIECLALTEPQNLTLTFKHWILPSLEVVTANNTCRLSKKITIIQGNYSALHIQRIESDQLGDYICLCESSDGRSIYSRSSLFFYRPPIWQTYRMHFIASLSSSAIFLAASVACCVITNLKWWRKTAPIEFATEDAAKTGTTHLPETETTITQDVMNIKNGNFFCKEKRNDENDTTPM